MIDMDNVILGDIGLGSPPRLTKLQAIQSLFGGYYGQQQSSSSAFNYVCPSSSSVNDNIYLRDADQLSTQQALHHTLISHDIRLTPFDSSSTSPPPSHAHQVPAVIEDAALINRINPLSHANTTSTGHLSCRQEKGGQEVDPKAPCLSYATSFAQYLSQGSNYGCSLSSSPFDTQLTRHLQYYDPCQVTSESFQPDDSILIASDVQDSNTSGSVNCMANRSGHNPPKAALSTSTSTSSTPSNISNGQLAQLAKETLQALIAYDTSSFGGKKSALMNIHSVSKMVNEGANKKRTGMTGNSTEQKKRRKKRRRISHKNMEEMETQRMTHIAVERNRRKQMNEHLRALRSLMPQSYIQRGDQASIVGGTIRFVEELEQVLQSLRLQKQLRGHHIEDYGSHIIEQSHQLLESPMDEIYANTQSCMANVEVTMLTSNTIFLKVLAQKKPHQLLDTLMALSKLSLRVTHLNITTIGLIVVYSFNLEMDNCECQLHTPCELAESIKHTLCV